jgi:hypothetical protein
MRKQLWITVVGGLLGGSSDTASETRWAVHRLTSHQGLRLPEWG